MANVTGYRIPNTANNFGGLGATDGTSEYNNFGSVYDGLLAQAQHLKGYATKAPLKEPKKDARYDILMTTPYPGTCVALENLTGDGTPGGAHWASDSQYDVSIKKILDYFGQPALRPKLKRIIWDPGHHINSDRGFIGNGPEDTEGANNWKVYEEAKKYFDSKYYGVLQSTRQVITDYPDLPQRAMMSWGTYQAEGADLFISFHSNASTGSGDIRGTEAYIPTLETNRDLADKLCDAVSKLFGHPNRGVKVNDFTVLKVAKAGSYTWQYMDGNEPSATGQYEPWNLKGGFRQSGKPAKMALLLEAGFHDNASDVQILTTKRAEIAKAIVDTIAEYFQLPPAETKPDTETPGSPGTPPPGKVPEQPILVQLPPDIPVPMDIKGFAINLFDETDTSWNHNKTILNTILSADIVENSEGIFEATVTIANDGYWSGKILPGMVIVAPYLKRREIFRIYQIVENISGSATMTIKARHITYDLKDIVIENPVKQLGGQFKLSQLLGFLASIKEISYLKFYTDIQFTRSYGFDFYLTDVWSYIMQPEKGLKDIFYAALIRNKNVLSLMENPGRKTDYVARLDKNALSITKKLDISDTVTHMIPYQKFGDKYVKGKEQVSYHASTFRRKHYGVIQTNVADKYENGTQRNEGNFIADIEGQARSLLSFGVGNMLENYTVDIVDIDELTGGSHDIELYDKITVMDQAHKINQVLNVLQIEYDALEERISKITIGNYYRYRR